MNGYLQEQINTHITADNNVGREDLGGRVWYDRP